MSNKFAVFTLSLCLAVCSQGPALAQSDKAQAPT
jgi:hypothetical protein